MAAKTSELVTHDRLQCRTSAVKECVTKLTSSVLNLSSFSGWHHDCNIESDVVYSLDLSFDK